MFLNNSIGFEWTDVLAFQQFRSNVDVSLIQQYYDRSERLVNIIKTTQGNTTQVWDTYKSLYINDFINSVQANTYELASTQILSMLDAIETEFNLTADIIYGGVASSCFMPFVTHANKLQKLTPLLILKENLTSSGRRRTDSVRKSIQPLVTLVVESGKRLTCSVNTVVTLEYGMTCYASAALNKTIPAYLAGKGINWELCTEVIPAGTGEILTISSPLQCYAAGNVNHNWIYTGRVYGNQGY